MTAACCTSPASGNCYWSCLKPQERLEPSHSRGVQKPPGRLHPVHAPVAQRTLKGDQLALRGVSNTKLDIIVETEFAAPTAARPSSSRPSPIALASTDWPADTPTASSTRTARPATSLRLLQLWPT